jgi:hypothetical protein
MRSLLTQSASWPANNQIAGQGSLLVREMRRRGVRCDAQTRFRQRKDMQTWLNEALEQVDAELEARAARQMLDLSISSSI